jgi:hypothetical protein
VADSKKDAEQTQIGGLLQTKVGRVDRRKDIGVAWSNDGA